jgi:hypothetical protein
LDLVLIEFEHAFKFIDSGLHLILELSLNLLNLLSEGHLCAIKFLFRPGASLPRLKRTEHLLVHLSLLLLPLRDFLNVQLKQFDLLLLERNLFFKVLLLGPGLLFDPMEFLDCLVASLLQG